MCLDFEQPNVTAVLSEPGYHDVLLIFPEKVFFMTSPGTRVQASFLNLKAQSPIPVSNPRLLMILEHRGY